MTPLLSFIRSLCCIPARETPHIELDVFPPDHPVKPTRPSVSEIPIETATRRFFNGGLVYLKERLCSFLEPRDILTFAQVCKLEPARITRRHSICD